MSGTLFVVATPIGNLEDVTLRALRILREADLIAAEDTRRTAGLLAHHAIRTPSLSFHQHNMRTRIPQILSKLRAGARVALVTDAGTPGVSDPGVELVEACVRAGVPVDPIPGVSAPLTAAIASGFPLIPLSIFGFPPRRAKDRTAWWSEIKSSRATVTFFESPLRIVATLKEAKNQLGVRQIVLARELTKKHQQFLRGTAEAVLEQLEQPRGEITVVVSPLETIDKYKDAGEDVAAVSACVSYFYRLTQNGAMSRREALTKAAAEFRIRPRILYDAIEKAKIGLVPDAGSSGERRSGP